MYRLDRALPSSRVDGLVQDERRVMPSLKLGGSDRRLWCTTANGLSQIMSALGPSTFFLSTHDLRRELIASKVYPARDFERFCVPQAPDVFVTYDWRPA